jgi:hypothetical protein
MSAEENLWTAVAGLLVRVEDAVLRGEPIGPAIDRELAATPALGAALRAAGYTREGAHPGVRLCRRARCRKPLPEGKRRHAVYCTRMCASADAVERKRDAAKAKQTCVPPSVQTPQNTEAPHTPPSTGEPRIGADV